MIQIDEFDGQNIRHAFFTRRGGVSGGIFTSLNCGPGSDDDPRSVTANRARAMAALDLPAEALVTNHQHHSSDVAVVDEGTDLSERRKADALVTARRNVALGVLAADCVPVLFASDKDGVIGAAHSGWRGALGGVCENTIDAMIELGARPDNIRVAIGPCIGAESYEVGPEFPAPFLKKDPSAARYFEKAERSGHLMFDISGYVASRLISLGLEEIFRLDCDTCKDEANFFSYRRSCHRNEPDYGRQLSAIVLGD